MSTHKVERRTAIGLFVAALASVFTGSYALADGGPSFTDAGEVVGPEFSYAPKPLLIAVQQKLATLGFYGGKIDGLWGQQSHLAFWEFCIANRVRPPTGLTTKLMSILWGAEPTDLSAAGMAAYWRSIGVEF